MTSLLTRLATRRGRWGVLGSLVAYGVITCHFASSAQAQGVGMFRNRTQDLIPFSTQQLNYGVAVADVDNDGEMEWIVAGYNGPNLVLKLDKTTGKYIDLAATNDQYRALQDPQGAAIGVCAGDVDGDGREEIYFLNTNGRYSGAKTYKDKLFKWKDGVGFVDLFASPGNDAALSMFAGRSVAAIDRKGTGKYSFILATYAQGGQGKFGLVEMDEAQSTGERVVLKNAAQEAGVDWTTGGRGITVGPIVGGDGFSDIFFVNEGSSGRGNPPENKLFKNDGTGHFTDVAAAKGLQDSGTTGRGLALADFNQDGKLDIVYGNWINPYNTAGSPHRLMIQQPDGTFKDRASPAMAAASPVRTVMAADFDNDGSLEVFFNNIVYQGGADPSTWRNRLFRVTPAATNDVSVKQVDIGDAVEPNGYGTGGAYADMDGDGVLELLLSHGESNAQDLSMYSVTPSLSNGNRWLRVLPVTQHGAPARGALVKVVLDNGSVLARVADGGSGYLCQMEPVAHFGLGTECTVTSVTVLFPDGRSVQRQDLGLNTQHRVAHPGGGSGPQARATGGGTAYRVETRRGAEEPATGGAAATTAA